MKTKYYSLKKILAENADYNIIIGERSNGKTFATLEYILKDYIDNKKEGAYIRRWRDDITGKRGENVFSAIAESGIVNKLTNGEYETIIFSRGGWHLAKTFSRGGGCGIQISNLRPNGAPVNNAAKTTTGPVSFMSTFSKVAETIGQNNRRGALMISIDCNHPDVEEFIDAKKNIDELNGCNISVQCTDDFMSKSNKVGTKEKELMMKLAENNWDYAEPGILFWDNINEYNLLSEYIKAGEFEYAGVNPCARG